VLVKRVKEEEKTKGGIIIPDTAKEKPQEGEVVAVGPGAVTMTARSHRSDVKAGDRILFGKWSGTEVKIDGEDLIIMKESDVLGVLSKRRPPRSKPRFLPHQSDKIRSSHMAAKHVQFATDARERCCAASTSSPTPSRSPSAPRAATS
jgi:chaperonin GroES